MKTSHFGALALFLALAGAHRGAVAQPDTENAPKADNPANRAPRLARPDRELMTPEARIKWFVKRQFSLLGADDAAQETLAIFVQSETQARQELTLKAQPLQTALRGDALSDTQVLALLNSYQGALEDEKLRRTKAIADLEKAIGFKKAPKIEAALTVAGLIGDGPLLNLGGGMGRGMMGGNQGGFNPGGMGGRGQNGGQNGRGNRRNQPGGNNGNNPPAQGV